MFNLLFIAPNVYRKIKITMFLQKKWKMEQGQEQLVAALGAGKEAGARLKDPSEPDAEDWERAKQRSSDASI